MNVSLICWSITLVWFLCSFEDLDHTADVQLHAWGPTITDAFENIVPCMFNYMTDLSIVEIKSEKTLNIDVQRNGYL